MRENTPLDTILAAKLFGGSGSVTPASIVTATGQMTSEQKSQTRANIGATDASTSIPDNVKVALLNCFDHVAWTDDQGQTYVDALEAALYPLDHITAVYTQSGTVYDTDSLDSLKADLVVTAVYEGGNTATVAAANYTLSGTLTEGTSTITVSYGGKTVTFDVTVTHREPLWETENQAFNGGNVDPTHNGEYIKLLANDADYSILYDVTLDTSPTSGDSSTYKLLRVLNTGGTQYSLAFGKVAAADTTLGLWYMAASAADAVSFGSASVGRHMIVVTHTAGSGEITLQYKYAGGASDTKTVTAEFTASTKNLVLGQSSGTNQLPKGTLNHVAVYDCVVSDDAIANFFGQ